MTKHTQSIDNQVISRVRAEGPGWVFTPGHLQDLGSHSAVSLALLRYKRAGTIQQLARGLYLFPRRSGKLGVMAPSVDDIAQALKDRDGTRIQPSGAHAANLLGLSDQVPMRAVYLTDGRSRTVQVGRQQIILKHTTPRNMATAGRISGTVIQALKWIGKKHVDDKIAARLRRKLSDPDKQQLLKDLRYAPAWIADVMRKVGARRMAIGRTEPGPDAVESRTLREKRAMYTPSMDENDVPTRPEIVKRLRAAEAEIRAFGVERLALFGSVLHGEASPASDVDLLVQFSPGRKTFDQLLALSGFLEDRLGHRVELVTTESLSPFIGPRILAEAHDVLRAA